MDLEKALKTVDIEPIRSLTFAEVGQIVQSFSQKLSLAFPNVKDKLPEMMEKLFACHMYLADIPESLGSANYFYKTQAIYFKIDTNFEVLDDYIVHECLHYLQDIRNEKRELQRMGLCRFKEFKIYNIALNEAAVQYIASKMLETQKESVEYGGTIINTRSPKYYPVLTSLIEQIVFLIGEDSFFESTLYSTDRFVYELIDIIGEGNFNKIQNSFDKILELKQVINNNEQNEIIKEYIKIQKILIQEYFKNALYFIKTKEEASDYKFKLENFKAYITDFENLKFYERMKEKQIQKYNKKIIDINNAKTLTVIKHSRFLEFFKKIQEWIFKEEYKIEK